MLLSRKSIMTGMPSHPDVRCLLPSVDVGRSRVKRSDHHLTMSFKSNTKIPHTAGGLYGVEFRPD